MMDFFDEQSGVSSSKDVQVGIIGKGRSDLKLWLSEFTGI